MFLLDVKRLMELAVTYSQTHTFMFSRLQILHKGELGEQGTGVTTEFLFQKLLVSFACLQFHIWHFCHLLNCKTTIITHFFHIKTNSSYRQANPAVLTLIAYSVTPAKSTVLLSLPVDGAHQQATSISLNCCYFSCQLLNWMNVCLKWYGSVWCK